MKDQETGFLVEKGNAEQIIEKISILLENKILSEKMGEKGRDFVEKNFNWDKIAKDFLTGKISTQLTEVFCQLHQNLRSR